MGRNRALGAPYVIQPVTAAVTTTWQVDEYDVDSPTAAVVVTLGDDYVNGDQVLIRDTGGAAATFNITIMLGDTTVATISQNLGYVQLTFTPEGTINLSTGSGGSSGGCAQPICNRGNAYSGNIVIGSTNDASTIIVADNVQVLAVTSNSVAIATSGTIIVPLTITTSAGTGPAVVSIANLNNAAPDATGALYFGHGPLNDGLPATGAYFGGPPTATDPRQIMLSQFNGVGGVPFYLDSTGYIGIGIQATSPALPVPAAQLDVQSTPAANGDPVAKFTNTSGVVTGAANNTGILVSAGVNSSSGSFTSNIVVFERPDGTTIGLISQATATTIAYNTTSDARLKENVKPSKGGLAVVGRLQVHDFNFIGDTTRQQGFIAQELAEVVPEVVTRGGDDPKKQPWAVDYGKLTPLLVLAIQELKKDYDARHMLHDEMIAKCLQQEATIAALSQQVEKLVGRAT